MTITLMIATVKVEPGWAVGALAVSDAGDRPGHPARRRADARGCPARRWPDRCART